MEERYVVLPESEYKKIIELLTRIADAHDARPSAKTDFPETGPVGVKQITAFLKIAPSTWWGIVKAYNIEPIKGFVNPRKWRAEDVWKLYEQRGSEAA